jgi:hypothetical protein
VTTLYEIDDNGNPLNDTWSDYYREHDWTNRTPVVEDGIPAQWSRMDITCGRCRQTRRVWRGVSARDIRWGCPRIPWRYRWRMRNSEIPTWSVSSKPPWLRGAK